MSHDGECKGYSAAGRLDGGSTNTDLLPDAEIGFCTTQATCRPANVAFTDQWLINNAQLDPARTYNVAVNDLLVSGSSTSSESLTRDKLAPVTEHGDVLTALIAELEAKHGKP